jgi:hypothetical protein
MNTIAERLVRCLPSASFELERLVHLVGIEETTEVPTAAVTCEGRARLRVNPDFVAQYCERDEHLFLLVMHEMWHVLLGHTTLYARPTFIHNIAFDALINAGLARQHPQPEYRGFFEELNGHDSFPALLLRPPLGWPHAPVYPDIGPKGTKYLLRRLYPPKDVTPMEPTYDEVLDILRAAPTPAAAAGDGGAFFVGDHDDDGTTTDPFADPLFADAVREVVGKWPPPPESLTGRDQGGKMRDAWFAPRHDVAPLVRRFDEVLREVLLPDRHGARRPRVDRRTVVVGPGPLPNHTDRQVPAKRRLRGGLVLPNQVVVLDQRTPDRPQRALVYLDVSGSMDSVLPHLLGLLAPLARRGMVRVRQFSTEVTPLPVDDLIAGKYTTTGGTDIACVLEDVATRPEKRVLLLTDGYVGTPPPHLLDPLVERGVRFWTALPHGGWKNDLESCSKLVELPALTKAS